MFVSNGNVLDEQDISPKGNGNDRDNTVSHGIDTFNRHSDTVCLVYKVNLTVFLMFGPISHPRLGRLVPIVTHITIPKMQKNN